MTTPNRQLRLSVLLALLLAVLFLPIATGTAASYSITTLFNSATGFAGNMFDVTVLADTDKQVDSFDVNVRATYPVTLSVYYREGGYAGYEYNESAWTFIGAATVSASSYNTPTHLPVGGVTLTAGKTYGFYITLENYHVSLMRFEYSYGSNTYTDENLQITCGIGRGGPVFTGQVTNDRTWNGTIYYSDPSAAPIPQTGDAAGRRLWLYVPLGMLCLSGLALLRKRGFRRAAH